jgi:hypothetical protein
MKKPIEINLSAIARIDPAPLKQALELYRKSSSDLTGARARLEALNVEIRDYLEAADPDDAAAVQLISGKKTQAEILPGLIRKVERNLETEIVPALRREASALQGALKKFYGEALDSVADQLATLVFRPYFSDRVEPNGVRVDRARAIALQSDDCGRIAQRRDEAAWVKIDDQPRSNNPAHFDKRLCEAAESLLALARES